MLEMSRTEKFRIFIAAVLGMMFVAVIPSGPVSAGIGTVSAQMGLYADFSADQKIIDSWLSAYPFLYIKGSYKTWMWGDGTYYTRELKPFRIMTGGYRLYKITDYPTEQKIINNKTVTLYKRDYDIAFDILLRTVSRSGHSIGKIIQKEAGYTAAWYWVKDAFWQDWSLLDSMGLYFKYLQLPENWRQNAEVETSGVIAINLEINPSFEFMTNYSAEDGTYKLNGIWAGIIGVRTPDDDLNISKGVMNANVKFASQLGTDDMTVSEENVGSRIKDPDIRIQSGGLSSAIESDFEEAGLIKYSTAQTDQVHYLVDTIYNTPSYDFDLWKSGTETKMGKITWDDTLGPNLTSVYFKYDFRLKPRVRIFSTNYTWREVKVYHNTGIFQGYTSTSKVYTTQLVTGYAIDNVYLIQPLIARMRIISTFEFEPKMPDKPPLNPPSEDRDEDIFNDIPTQSGKFEKFKTTETPPIGDIFMQILKYILAIMIIALALYITIKIVSARSGKKRTVEIAVRGVPAGTKRKR